MRIGLTGGVGSGATEVAEYLKKKGIPVISADEVGHRALMMPEVKHRLIERFGAAILDSEGEIDRGKLGEIVFSDEQARRNLNQIIHPVLLDMLSEQVRSAEKERGIVVVDAALIYEWGLQGFFHKVIAVSAPMKLRLERTMKRSGLSEEQVRRRIAAQMPLEEKAERADVVISNQGSISDLHKRVDEVWGEILRSSKQMT